jgi:type III secretion protein X
MAIDILNPSLGLQGFLEPLAGEPHLPGVKPLASNVLVETSLAQHFGLESMSQTIERGLVPLVPDEKLLRPDVFKRNLKGAFDRLKSSRQPQIRKFVRDDLAPIMEDAELYDLLAGLLIGG